MNADFVRGSWTDTIDVHNFITRNTVSYSGDEQFLSSATQRTKKLWEKVLLLMREEQKKGILDLDVETPSTILSHLPGYIDKKNEIIVGLQTDKPLKRAIKPKGGIQLVQKAAEAYGYHIPQHIIDTYTNECTTHNDAVFSAYTPLQKLLRSKHIITGLPDNYGRGRIIGDYRRVPLYGTKKLIEERLRYLENDSTTLDDDTIQLRREVFLQIQAFRGLTTMANSYGYDISVPAMDSKEAVQWLYFAYLAAVKEQDGAAMSLGRIDAFLDCYFERDLRGGLYSEQEIQEILDDFVIKLRLVRHLRHPEYDALFAGDPTWVTLALGGSTIKNKSLVTKTSFRLLHTLTTLGPAPEPNLTVLWSKGLPSAWKKYCAKQSINTSSIQYENDDLMREYFDDDYAIACCVSGMSIGKDMQYFGARANLAKVFLLAINGGKEEPHGNNDGGDTIVPGMKSIKSGMYLHYEDVWKQFTQLLDWLAKNYVDTMNIIHYMHDRYNYESAQMALHDVQVRRFMAFGLAGLSVVADSLSAIKYARVKPVWNRRGVAEHFIRTGTYPTFGNDDDRVDSIAIAVIHEFMRALRRYSTYRRSIPTLSILTITSNVVYGSMTGETPDGRSSGAPFAPGANPLHGRDTCGAISALNSVAKLPYKDCLDGISNTMSFVPHSLGRTVPERLNNLVQLFDGYFVGKHGHHLNVNVMQKETLREAQKHPEQYPQLTIRVSGYAVLFNRLSSEQQEEVIARTFHENL